MCFILFFTASLQAQSVYGTIRDTNNDPIIGAYISDSLHHRIVQSDERGHYEIPLPADEYTTLTFRFVGYMPHQEKVIVFGKEKKQVNVILAANSININPFVVKDRRLNTGNINRIDPKQFEKLPNPSGNIERLIMLTQPGVFSNNELSAQYSVRGGNFDENLIYVNDFEVYRPFLIRSGQQEGLSFVNPDLVGSLAFSSGGFEARYGDKLSSVLDVKYKNPQRFGGSVSGSLLGFSAHLEGQALKKKLSYLVGFRNKSNRYLLNALPTSGGYQPLFYDIQSYLTYRLTPRWQLQFIGNYAFNRFQFIPESLESSFGTVSLPLRLRVAFDGQEQDQFASQMAGVSALYTSSNNRFSLKMLASAYNSRETERFNIIGSYFIGEVESDLGKEEFGQVVREFGVGSYHSWARNKLNANVANMGLRAGYDRINHYINAGLTVQKEWIEDQLNEWNRVDSADYNLPFSIYESEDGITLQRVLKSVANIQVNRVNAFVQDRWSFDENDTYILTYGLRASFGDLNNELLLMPRTQFTFHPNLRNDSTDLVFRLSSGFYHQPPFFREMRNRQGVVNTDLKAQKSWHWVAGMDYQFFMWQRPFKFTTEVYYKRLWDLVSYEIENVLIRYSGKNDATGYAAGLDMRLNGEFVQGVESWVTFSLLSTKEDLKDDFYYQYFDAEGNELFVGYSDPALFADTLLVTPGAISRPTDQHYNFTIFFQDYLRGKENFKVNLALILGGPLPFSPPGSVRFRNDFRSPIYGRVDIGFSALLHQRGKKELPERHLLNRFEKAWIALEVFNLLGVPNTVSYSWVNDFSGRVWGIPNRLTTRRLNLRLTLDF
ncbi:MAG: carboxypeptidase-like regulatory domain-containing protein [Sphingobacteriales bacterium]|nr:carboxypeptidase-like regulatory domain-containing protein [Sphingobacteriales bacterium]